MNAFALIADIAVSALTISGVSIIKSKVEKYIRNERKKI